ncbi:hypothetical protein PFICI_00799 [Pestalotiopsis fici W106-1]|uniref:MARVEL domain-containing protein n=1 Tax=Pestalotiopsis fici (strain W106-1 / CGMCC3.15140) TaxID=1229662 RepID=W3XNW9_PESFW|nr:uncharacterized protein PFICI_00799 [Pestalotiopsis fici W106-1]ETS86971.1 hypothetical protein PFICI_00799 [Pestalotiopsis fici W106-1]
MAFLLNPRYILAVHMVQLFLVITVIVLAVARIFIKGGQLRRNDTMALSMGAKSLGFLAYELITEHWHRARRWASLKANTILNCLEILFWAAIAFLAIQTNVNSCLGTSCTINWVIVVLAIITSIVSAYAAAIFYIEFRKSRQPVLTSEVMMSDSMVPLDQHRGSYKSVDTV